MRLPLLLAACALFSALLAWQPGAFADELQAADVPEGTLTAAIDAEIAKLWQRDGVAPAPACSDEEFVRRAYLDVAGMPPSADETLAFLQEKTEGKRDRLIDSLVSDKRFSEHIADQWVNILCGRSRSLDNADMILGAWMARQIQQGRGFDDIIYDMLTAEGAMSNNPASAYFAGIREFRVADVAGEAARHFTGVQIQCAQCHDHPYEDEWKETEFNGVASFFTGIQVRRNGNLRPVQGIVGDRNVGRTDPQAMMKRVEGAKTSREAEQLYEALRYRAPKYLLGEEVKVNDSRLWRKAWAKWVVSEGNTQTQRYLANRFWAFLFGLGIANPVDDFNGLNLPSHPELLDLLSNDFRASGYDVRRLYRAVLKTRAWQAASTGATRESGNVEAWHFAQSRVRQLSPEQFFGALLVVAGHAENGKRRMRVRVNPYDRERQQGEQYLARKEQGKLPKNQRKLDWNFEAMDKLQALIDTMSIEWRQRRLASRQYSRISSDDEMLEADAFSLTIDQALLLMNGNVTTQLSASGRGGVLDYVAGSATDVKGRIDRMFMIVLSRAPTAAEHARYAAFVKEAANERQAWEDALFSLLLTSEFGTNH